MKICLLSFGIARDIMGHATQTLELPDTATIHDLKAILYEQHPRFQGLPHLFIAVNTEYATDDTPLNSDDEIALIPPVSGG
jgi:molybdopterin synthase sulfur carrier subunit